MKAGLSRHKTVCVVLNGGVEERPPAAATDGNPPDGLIVVAGGPHPLDAQELFQPIRQVNEC